jgi:spore coat protein U-like protein
MPLIVTTSDAAIADTLLPTTQTFAVSAQIVAGCGVVDGGATSGLNFGTIDFGTYPSVQTGPVSGVTSGASLRIECSRGTNLLVTIDGGVHASGANAQRHLSNSGGTFIEYRLYEDAAHTRTFAVGQPVSIPVTGTLDLPIYGALTLPGGNTPPGTYTDTAQVTLSY